ncbi:hypothetical protein A0H81_05647 [Grifola frondosa]|uniref:C2H2-type domain-containing protein n=1 Tax=Grifola frondosa TaxID=5627 RepID=A0A1C7MCL6_GRIFR|nr:hypothetical protein A0H81_05647 [Grifola frondosa]
MSFQHKPRHLEPLVAQTDKNNIITNPSRLIRGPDGQNAPPRSAVTDMWATERSWNGYCYECCLCHRTYASLTALNAHLRSPAHADKIYRCPRQANGCGAEFKTLSAFWQHMESGQCGVCRFRREIDSVMDSLTSRMGRLMAA